MSSASERLQQARELLGLVQEIVLGHHEGEEMEVPNVWGNFALVTYSRTRSLLEGVASLVEARLPEEALMLVRSLLTDSLLLSELAARPDDRLALAFGWLWETNNRVAALGRAAEAVGLPRADEWAPETDRRRAALKEAMKAHGVKRMERFGGEHQLAQKHGRAREYWDYKMMSEVIHRPDLAQMSRQRRPSTNTLHMYLRNDDPDFLAAALVGAMTSALHVHKAAAKMFGWTETTEEVVDDLLLKLENLFPDMPEPGS